MKKADLAADIYNNISSEALNCQFYTLVHARLILMTKNVKRLFEQFAPRHYIVDLRPDSERKTFSGSVIVSGQKVGKPSSRITFHQNGLMITHCHVISHPKSGDKKLKVKRVNHHDSLNEVRLHLDEMLYPGNYTVSLTFSGKITPAMNGIYPCDFKYKGKSKQIIATQFESHHAREVLPCIDEPEAKATFDLTLRTPKNETVISNTPIKETRYEGKEKVTTFETTPTMSTYLLAFVYGKLDYKETKTKSGVTVRAYATPDNVELTDFTLDTAKKCLEFYSSYFGIDYPLQKCDLVALPDFASGAMENWGCITFREQAMLVDPKHTSLASKQYVALVVAHELAHMWFGNLVTMKWWTDLWLNEGFASWVEYLAVDSLFPEWKMWTQFVVDEQQQALKLDALEHTHPVEVRVNHPDEIRTIFDAISYSKGASIIHMLNNYLGANIFKAGLSYYLKKHSYSNTTTDDLWNALEEVSHKPVKKFMHAWTNKPGFPILDVKIEQKTVSIRQDRFVTNPKNSVSDSTVWPVALLSHNPVLPELQQEQTLKLKIKDVETFKLNRGQSGFYRTTYNVTHLQKLGEAIKAGRLSDIDRLGLLADLSEAAKAGKADTADALYFLENFVNEDNYAVWDTISSLVGSIKLVMDDDGLRDIMKPFIRQLISQQLERLGWERKKNDTHFDRLLRPIILGLAASADEPAVVEKCFKLFAKIKDSGDLSPDFTSSPSKSKIKRGIDIDPDLRGMVYGTVARLGGKTEFNKLLKLHNGASLSEERVTLSAALTGFKQPELIHKALGLITTDKVRRQDAAYWIVYSFLNRYAKTQTWDWLKANWSWLLQQLGTDLSFYRMPIYAARSFSDIKFLKEYKKFFESVMSVSLKRSYNQGIEMIEWQSEWKKRALPEVTTFFKSYSSTGKKSDTIKSVPLTSIAPRA